MPNDTANTNNGDSSVVQTLEKSQCDLVNLLEQLKTQNKVIKQAAALYKTKHSKKPVMSVVPAQDKAQSDMSTNSNTNDNGSPNIISFPLNGKDVISFRTDTPKDKATETSDANADNELEKLRKENEAKERKLQEQEAKLKMLEELEEKNKQLLQQREYAEQLQQKERMDAIEREQKVKEDRARIEREMIEKQREQTVEKERQLKELEMKLKQEMDEKERVVRLLQEKEKYEKELMLKQQEEERMKREMEEQMKAEKERHEKELRAQIENEVKQKLQSELNSHNSVPKPQTQHEGDAHGVVGKSNDSNANEVVNADEHCNDSKNDINEDAVRKSNSIAFEIEEIEEIKDSPKELSVSSKRQSRVSSQLPSIRNNTDHKREMCVNSTNEQEEQNTQQHNNNTNVNPINSTNQTVQNEINTFLPSQKADNNANTNNISLSNEDEAYVNPKTKEIEKIKAQREREKAELLSKAKNANEPRHSHNNLPSKRSTNSNDQPNANIKHYVQQEDVSKILAAACKREINLTINKAQFTQITKIDVKEKPYMQGSTEPPSNYLFQRRRKALMNQRYFTEYILKEKNLVETVKKITQNYQDLLEESLKQFEQEKPFSSIFNVVLGHDNNFKEEISNKLNIPSIINANANEQHQQHQQQTFRSSSGGNKPKHPHSVVTELIGPIQNMTSFAMVYSLTNKDTQVLKELMASFTFWRKIKTDGNSFYRTFMFALLEYFIFIKNIHEIQKVILGVMRLADDDILSNGQRTIDFKEVLGIFYFIYDQLSKGNYYQAYLVLLNAYKLENNAFDNAMNLYCKYAIYCIVEHLYNVYLRPQGNNIMNDGRAAATAQEQFSAVDKVNPSIIMKFYHEPMKLVFSVIPFIFNVNLEIVALDGALNKQGNNVAVVNTKFTDYSLNDLPVISVGYFLSSYHKIYTRDYQTKVLSGFVNDIFNDNTVMPVSRGVYIDPKGDEYSCDKCGVTSTLIYFPKQQLSICSQCFLRDTELILKVRASDFNREKCNNIECK